MLNRRSRAAIIITSVALAAVAVASLVYKSTPQLLRIEIRPNVVLLRVGESQSVTAYGVYSDGAVRPLVGVPMWSSSEDGVVRLEPQANGTSTVVVGLAQGVVSVSAKSSHSSGHMLVGVSDRPPQRGPLAKASGVRRHFVGADGRAVWLAGSHVWTNLQDIGPTDPPAPFDYAAYLDFLVANGHNFIRLWRSEQAKWSPDREGDWFVHPHPWLRTGPGVALDGKPKFDLDEFNPAYFERLRERVASARERGVFVSVMLFNGWSVELKGPALENPWRGHPFHRDNNINGIDGDPDRDDNGRESHTLAMPKVLDYQRAYVRHVIETLNDLDNVLYEVSNESSGGSMAWQSHLVQFVHELESQMPMQHPVGVSAERPGESNDALFASPADWIAPFRYNDRPLDPFPWHGEQVILSDSDHLCGVCGSVAWAWKTLMRGHGALLMDPYDAQVAAIGGASDRLRDEDWPSIRRNMGYARVLSEWIDISGAEPWGGLASTGYALANVRGPEARFLVFSDDAKRVRIDIGTRGIAVVRWLEVASGRLGKPHSMNVQGPLEVETPFDGSAVLLVSVPLAPG